MAMPKRKFVALFLSAVFITGCSSVKIVRNPDDGDSGVRFYRPKPFLLVTPADPTGRLVNMKLEYLPDFNEEYSAHVKGKASVALKDGWNLVGVNTKEAPKEKEEPPAKIEAIPLPPAVVSATNVPIGYYESVYGFQGEKKFLAGWRYIGMTVLGGGQPGVCRVAGHNPNCPQNGTSPGCINGPLYGLVFFNGVMTFRQLDEIANNQLCPMYVNPTPADPSPTKPAMDPGQVGAPPVEIPSGKVGAPPVPAATPPAPGSTSLYRPKVTPALVVVKPASVVRPAPTTTPTASAPAGTSLAARPATSKPVVATIAKKPSVAPASSVASTDPLKAQAARSVVAPPSFEQDPLMMNAPSLDQDLLRTGSSPKR